MGLKTPEERLCSWRWRLMNSGWVLWPILSAGLLAGIGFLYVALKAKVRTWLVWAIGWTVTDVVLIVLMSVVDSGTKQDPINTPASNAVGLLLFLTWAGSSLHAFFLNRGWLRWRASHPRGTSAWYVEGAAPPPSSAQPAAPTSSVPEAREPSLYGAATNSKVRVDVNTADAGALKSVGLSDAQAASVLEARNRLGSYSSVDQLMTEAGIAPHVFISVRDRLAAPERQGTSPASPQSGRRLDL